MIAGALIGLLLVVEGSLRDIVGTRVQRWCGSKESEPAE
jgi:hypothetical protein